jgi:hypothetical protein
MGAPVESSLTSTNLTAIPVADTPLLAFKFRLVWCEQRSMATHGFTREQVDIAGVNNKAEKQSVANDHDNYCHDLLARSCHGCLQNPTWSALRRPLELPLGENGRAIRLTIGSRSFA